MNKASKTLRDMFKVGAERLSFGDNWCGPDTHYLGTCQDELVAIYPAGEDGHDVSVYLAALPSLTYNLVWEASGVQRCVATGTGLDAAFIAWLAKNVAEGMIAVG